MQSARRVRVPAIGALVALALTVVISTAGATSGRFYSRCATSGCHTDDALTCNGCHNHMGSLRATADRTSYRPGDPVVVTFTGGQEYGWIRATLYDQDQSVLERKSGPTGTGNDGQSGQVTFPVTFHVSAPATTGDYVWRAGWFGNDDGAGHIERTTSVTIHVAYPTADVTDAPPVARRTWGRIRTQFR